MVTDTRPHDADAILAWVADRLDRRELYDPSLDDWSMHTEQRNVSTLLFSIRARPFQSVAQSVAIRWPGQGNVLVLQHRGHDGARLVADPSRPVPVADLTAFRTQVVAALRPRVEHFLALSPTDRLRRRLSAMGIRTDLTRRRWSLPRSPSHWALADRIDFTAADTLLAENDPHTVRQALEDTLRAAADPAFRELEQRKLGLIGLLSQVLRIAPDHLLLRASVCEPSDVVPAEVGTSVVRYVDPCGRDLAIVHNRSRPVAAYDLRHAHPVPVPRELTAARP